MSSEAFARVPLWLLGRSDVSWAGKVLYGLLARYVGKGRSAWPSVNVLAGDMRTSRRNVERWLGELRGAGLIDVERTGRASTYRLLGSAPEEAPPDTTITVPDTTGMADPIRQDERIGSASDGTSDPPSVADQIRQPERIVPADTSFCEEKIEKTTEESRPSGGLVEDSERIVEGAHRALLSGYQRRYEAAVHDVWLGADRAHRDIRACARWAVARGAEHVEGRVEQLLDGVFADARLAEERWPWAWVAKDPARYASPARPSERGRPKAGAYVALRAKPDDFAGGGELDDADFPEGFELGKERVIGYG